MRRRWQPESPRKENPAPESESESSGENEPKIEANVIRPGSPRNQKEVEWMTRISEMIRVVTTR